MQKLVQLLSVSLACSLTVTAQAPFRTGDPPGRKGDRGSTGLTDEGGEVSRSCEVTQASLQFATVTWADGCPLTLYFLSSSSSEAFLAPALCLPSEAEIVLAAACSLYDPVLKKNYISLPLTLTDHRLRMKAETALGPLLQNRTLAFLQPLSVQSLSSQAMVELLWEPGWETGHLRLLCANEICDDVHSQFADGRWDLVEEVELELEFAQLTPRSQPISMRRRISVANRSRILTATSAPPVLPAPLCSNLRHQQSFTVDGSCRAIVHQRTDRKGHFVIEPLLCYQGNHNVQSDARGGVVRLTLEVQSDGVRDSVRRKLSSQSPLSVTFMSLVGAELRVAKLLSSNWTFETLRLLPDGDTAELRVRCGSEASCRQFTSSLQLSPVDLWRRLPFSVDAQLETQCSWRSHKFAVPLKQNAVCHEVSSVYLSSYHLIYGLMCMKPQFVQQLPMQSTSNCAFMCSRDQRCQAFSVANGPCQLFVFDKCSKDVIDCSCSRRGPVFVKKQPGLQPGSLCPPGYGDDLCGVKYKLHRIPGSSWSMGRRKCESESGLVIMADVIDATEMSHINMLHTKYSSGYAMWLGGYQAPGSAEPAGGWYWVGCNITVNRSLWGIGEPNDASDGKENAISKRGEVIYPGLNDGVDYYTLNNTLCECVSPFS